MFFKLHDSAKIGCKLLSEADLWIWETSHQTHIWLFEDTLDFIDNTHHQSFAQFIYEDSVKELATFLDLIKKSDGSYRSPKIRSWNRSELSWINVNSVVKEIREIVDGDINNKWYLMWFWLDNNDIIFFLFKQNDKDYNYLTSFITWWDSLDKLSLWIKDSNFEGIIEYLNSKINKVNIEYLEELESIVQLWELSPKLINRVNTRKYDIEKAKKRFIEVWRKGEELINTYLKELKNNWLITSFEWFNSLGESYLPYDFEIIDKDWESIFSDVKTTWYKFEQDMFFSWNELRFIKDCKKFIIYRVYNIDTEPLLKICDNIINISEKFTPNYDSFNFSIVNEWLKVKNINIWVSPKLDFISFSNDIKLV